MESASRPSGVPRMKSARAVCISEFPSQLRVHPPAVEDALRIELPLELLVDLHEGRGERLKNADRLVAAAEERGVTARPFRRIADGARVGARAEPAQRPAPLDERLPGKLEGRRGRRNRDAPQRRAVPEKRAGVLANPRPEALALLRLDELAADLIFRGGDRGSPAATMPPSVAPSPKCGGSKASICPRSRIADSMAARRVPQRAVITSSEGS